MNPSLSEVTLLGFWAVLWSLVGLVYFWATFRYMAWSDVTLRTLSRGVLEILLVDIRCGVFGKPSGDPDLIEKMDAAALRLGVVLSALAPMMLGLLSMRILQPPVGVLYITFWGAMAVYASMLGAHLHLRVALKGFPRLFHALFWSSMLIPSGLWLLGF